MKQEDKHKNKTCWWWRGPGTIHSKAENECKNCSSKKCKRRLKKQSRRNINREAVIEQITEQLHSSTSPENVFTVSNIILNTNFSIETHRLVSRL